MARLNRVGSFRGTSKTPDGNLTCGKCRATIKKGDSYRWWANRLPGQRGQSVRNIRCAQAACTPKPSEMTPGRAGELMAIQEDAGDRLDALRETRRRASFASRPRPAMSARGSCGSHWTAPPSL